MSMLMASPIKRRWDEYPVQFRIAANRIALASKPTLNEHFDAPPMRGPFATRNATNIYRSEWHRFREALRNSGDDTQAKRLIHILAYLTTLTISRLRPDGVEEWFIEFAPHPIILSEWRADPDLFERDQIWHSTFINPNVDPRNEKE